MTATTTAAQLDLDHAPYAGLKLNPGLDVDALARSFAAGGGRLQIPAVFTAETAAYLQRVLAKETPWGLAYYDEDWKFLSAEEVKALPQEQARALNQQILARARERYQYRYRSYPMLMAYQEGWAPEHPLMRFFEFLNSDVMLELIRAVSGLSTLRKADAQATYYAPGDFLTRHTDYFPDDQARLAYVFNFTSGWQPDWGGYLQFFEESGDIERALMPRFNLLNLFTVPRAHSVAQVAPFAGAPRLSITGWFREV